MTSGSTVLRPADASIDDGLLFARYLDEAADGAFRALLGKKYDRVIGEAFLSPGHDLSYETVVFADKSGRAAGMVSGYTSGQHALSSDQALHTAAGFRMVRMAAFSMLGRGLKRFIKTVPEGDYYVQAVAVDDQLRGSGIGTMLLDHSEEMAKAAGCRRIALDVAQNNSGARRLYERRGMAVEATSPAILFIPSTRAHRMAKPL